MTNLTTRTKYVNLVIRKLDYPINFENKLDEYVKANCSVYSYIKHLGDINGYGEVEDLHYHLVLTYKDKKRLSTRLYEICDFFGFRNSNGIEISKTGSEVASIQYLLHKNNLEKTPHKIDEIISSYPRDELQTIIDSECDSQVTFDYVMKLIRQNPSKIYLIQALGITTYKNYRNVILDMLEEYRRMGNSFID